MNHIYLYQYKNGHQFLSIGTPDIIWAALRSKFTEVPRCIGRWRYKSMNWATPGSRAGTNIGPDTKKL